MNSRQKAHELAQEYFSMIAEAAGIDWGKDEKNDIRILIAVIINAAKEEMKEETGYYLV